MIAAPVVEASVWRSLASDAQLLDATPLPADKKLGVLQPFGLSAVQVRNWSSLFLNRTLNVVSEQ